MSYLVGELDEEKLGKVRGEGGGGAGGGVWRWLRLGGQPVHSKLTWACTNLKFGSKPSFFIPFYFDIISY